MNAIHYEVKGLQKSSAPGGIKMVIQANFATLIGFP